MLIGDSDQVTETLAEELDIDSFFIEILPGEQGIEDKGAAERRHIEKVKEEKKEIFLEAT